MKLFVSCFLAIALSSLAGANPDAQLFPRVKETVDVPRNWARVGPAPPNHQVELRIGLPQPNFPTLERHLYEVSDPSHERYGAHLSKEEAEALVAPHPESISLVDEWLSSHGLESADIVRSPAKDWVTLKIPVELAERMLNTTYYVWKHLESGDHLVRTTSYSLPSHLHEHVDLVQPTTIFALWKTMKTTLKWEEFEEEKSFTNNVVASANKLSAFAVDPSCNSSITISCLQQLYKTVGYVPKAAKKNSIGITGYLEQFANIEDLQSFYAEQLPEALNSTFKFISVKGGLNNQTLKEAGLEANLDVQFAYGLSYPTPGTFWSTAGRPPFKPDLTTPTNTNEPYADWLDYVLLQPKVPLSISTSYGEAEQTVPKSYARRVCNGLGLLGARGVSLMFSSGDGGVGDGNSDPATQECLTNDGRNITRFMPLFPASCP